MKRKSPSDLLEGAQTISATVWERPSVQTGRDQPQPLPLVDPAVYRVEGEIAQGGGGRILRAFDLRLERWVALKVLHVRDPLTERRFEREARVTARLEHPSIVPVHEVGRGPTGEPYYVMKLVSGKSLNQVIATMASLDERLALLPHVITVTEAIAYAHSQRIIHRDLKPSNIMVGAFGEAVVIDWGLAKDLAATTDDAVSDAAPEPSPDRTVAGAVLGTPAYMPPEQANGEPVAERADVYSLGAVLYAVLAGRAPHEGSDSRQILDRARAGELTSLREREPGVPVELVTIVNKAMQRDPALRYPDAGALAEDLRRFYTGRMVSAHHYSWGVLALRWLRRNRVLALALAVVSLLVAYVVHARRAAAEQTALAQTFGQEVERNDAIARYSALLPLHDARNERHLIEANLAELERQMATLGHVAEGPGRYSLGRGYLVLDRPEDARRELRAAWDLGYRTPEVSYALGLAYGELYRIALAEVENNEQPAQRARARSDIERRLRDPALAQLRASQDGRSQLAPEFVEGLIALHEHHYDEALAKARAAQARVPWLYEALRLEADVHVERAGDAWARSDAKDALDDLVIAGERYRAALAIAHSDSSALGGACHQLVLMAVIQQAVDQEPAATVQDGLHACDDALAVRPDDAELYAEQALAWYARAHYDQFHNAQPRASWLEAERLASRAAALAPDDIGVLHASIRVRQQLASFLIDHGEDPLARLEVARAAAHRLLQLAPNDLAARTSLSDLWQLRGDWEAATGADPRVSYDTGSNFARSAQALAPDDWSARSSLGTILMSRGMWELNHGIDVKPNLTAAAEQFEAVLKMNPRESIAAQNLCATLAALGQAASHDEEEPVYARALVACQRAYELRPSSANAANASSLDVNVAQSKLEHGASPVALLEQARQMQRRAVAVDAANPLAYFSAGTIEALQARWDAMQNRSPLAALTAAEADFTAALRLNPRDADSLCSLAAISRRRAEWRAAHHQPIDNEVAAGLRQAAAALAINAVLDVAVRDTGVLHLMLARVSKGERQRQEAARAVDALARATAINRQFNDEVAPLLAEARGYLTK